MLLATCSTQAMPTSSVFCHVWKRVFEESKLEPPEDVVQSFLGHYDPSAWDWCVASQFTEELAGKCLASLRHTGTGKDGIHNFCSKYGNEYCAKYIVKLFDAFCNGEALPLDINEGLFVYLQKKSKMRKHLTAFL